MEKKWYESSTIWINLAGIVAVILEAVLESNFIPDKDVTGIIFLALNILNRFRVKPSEKIGAIEKTVI